MGARRARTMDPLLVTYALNLAYQLAVLALVVLGLGIVFGLLGIMNMAHGEFVMLGAYSAVAVQEAGLPLLLALPFAVLVCGATGWLAERLLIRPLANRPFDTLLATWGLSILIRKAVEAGFGRGYKSIEHGMTGTSQVLGADYPTYRLALLASIVVALVALALWYRRSPAGARVQAMVANPGLAQALGLDTRAMARNTFVIGVASAGIAGCHARTAGADRALHGTGLPAQRLLRAGGGRARQPRRTVRRQRRHRRHPGRGLEPARPDLRLPRGTPGGDEFVSLKPHGLVART